MKETISVVIPVYNSSTYLRECVESVLAQSWRELDIILVDDGSTDESPAICVEYAEKDSRVRFFQLEPVGVGAARNYGISQAQGKYLMFVDSDDVCEAELAERLVEGMMGGTAGTVLQFRPDTERGEPSPCSARVMVLCGITVTDAEGNETGAFREEGVSGTIPVREYIRDVLAKWQSNPLCGGVYCELFETEILNKYDIRFEEKETYAEDFLFNLAYLKHVDEVTMLPDTLYRYRVGRSGSLTEENMAAADPEKVWERRKQVIAAYEDVFAGAGLEEECASAIQAFFLKNITDMVEMAVRQDLRYIEFKAWMELLRKQLESSNEISDEQAGISWKYRLTLKLLRQRKYGTLRVYEASRLKLRLVRGRER